MWSHEDAVLSSNDIQNNVFSEFRGPDKFDKLHLEKKTKRLYHMRTIKAQMRVATQSGQHFLASEIA